jgi:hypothetical protein
VEMKTEYLSNWVNKKITLFYSFDISKIEWSD